MNVRCYPDKESGMLNSYFEKIFYINLDRRIDRKLECEKEFTTHQIIAERVSATDAMLLNDKELYPRKYFKHGNYGLLLTNLKIFEEAIAHKYKSILIFEDDVLLIDNFTEYFDIIYPTVPLDWDILYLGGNHVKSPTMVADNVGRCNLTYTTHAVAFKESSYDTILQEIIKLNDPIDVLLCKLYNKLNAYTILPSLAVQRPSFSNIEDKFADYTRFFI
jgi:GR25 family glycosyltransferase involved in LPS biosynthesis